MRLTLRTMLAYLDEILEPEDQAEIGQKVKDSEFASDLARRTRDVIGKLRLGAPALSGRGVAIDPNTVAEYLDNSLAAERVADFERACLEADVCLAEVAACHQILTLVLGQPAEVDAGTRERIYALGATAAQQVQDVSESDDVEQESVVAAAEPTAEAVAAAEGGSHRGTRRTRRKREIPDYLRDSSGLTVWRFVAAAVVVALLLGAATLVFGPREMVDGLLGRSDRVPQQTEGDAPSSSDTTAAGAGTASRPAERTQLDQPSATAGEPAAAAAAPIPPAIPVTAGDNEADQAVEPAADPAEPPRDSEVLTAAAAGSGQVPDGQEEPPLFPPDEDEPDSDLTPPVQDAGETFPGMTSDADAATESGSDLEPPLTAIPGGTVEPPEEAATAGTDTTEGAAEVKDPEEANGAPADEGAAAAVAPRPELGIYSNTEILLSFDEELAQWRRMPLRAAISADERLLAPPSFRPQVTLTSGSGVTLDMTGPASLVLQASDPPAQGPGIDLLYGRIILLNVGQAGNQLAFRIGDQQYLVEFGDVGATLAIEVSRHHVPGADPEVTPTLAVADIYATSGKLQWQVASTDVVTAMVAPSQWRIVAGQLEPVPDAGPPPDWINAGGPSGLELRAARAIDEELSNAADRPVSLVLQELVEGQRSGRRSEVRSLAARCAVHVGKFEPFVEALNDPEQKTWRPRLIESLEEALALGPDVAAAIRQAFIQQHGDEAGTELYRLLRGFNGADLEDGADKQLVDYLHHDQLDFRLLALWNLIRITGFGQTNRLQDPKASRFQLARRWEKRLEDDEIKPKQPQ